MYKILLEGKQVKKNQVTGMHLMAGFLLLVMGFITWLVPDTVKQGAHIFLNAAGIVYSLLGLAIIIICIFFNKKVIQTKANFVFRILEFITLATILIYTFSKKWYLPAAYSGAALLGITLAYYWEKNGKRSRIALFSDEGISVPGLGRKSRMPWKDVTRVLFRHHILTIDCRDNKLFQLPADRNGDLNFDKQDFEDYCRIQIEAKKHLYQEDW